MSQKIILLSTSTVQSSCNTQSTNYQIDCILVGLTKYKISSSQSGPFREYDHSERKHDVRFHIANCIIIPIITPGGCIPLTGTVNHYSCNFKRLSCVVEIPDSWLTQTKNPGPSNPQHLLHADTSTCQQSIHSLGLPLGGSRSWVFNLSFRRRSIGKSSPHWGEKI